MITTRISQLPVGTKADLGDDAHLVMNSTANPIVDTVRIPVGTLKDYMSHKDEILVISDDTDAEDHKIYLADLTVKDLNLQLPSAATNEGFHVTVKVLPHGGSYRMDILTTGKEAIDGNASYSITKDWAFVTLVATSTNDWIIISVG